MSLAELVAQTVQQWVSPGQRLVVGVSGGADSLALLHSLHVSGGYALHAATLDHGLRGAASAEDARVVADLCASWGVPVTIGTLTPEDMYGGTGVENAARVARYAFLARVAREVGAAAVAVAHHADDQAETVLLHLIRGSGLQGLSGMAVCLPLPGHADLLLIRPLLRVSRREIEAYCRAHDLQPRQDATNADTHLLRNAIRLELLPRLRLWNPQIDTALTRLADAAALDMNYLRQQLEGAIVGHVTQEDERIVLPQRVFRGLPPALQHHYIQWSVQQLHGQDLAFVHITRAVELASTGTTGQQMPLPGHFRLRLDYDRVILERSDAPLRMPEGQPWMQPGQSRTIHIPGDTPLPGSAYILETSLLPLDTGFRLVIEVGQRVEIRTRRPGDRFAPLGLGGHTQKVKKWMIDHKVPQAVRDRVPIVTVEGEIAALIVGGETIISQTFAVRDSMQPVVYLRFKAHPQA
ncbi:MAG: tRNA lysidine(34) synthetase TilS [Anaerolineae bacterium]|nr:tRNA lysidine(34) synthetase TilS [Anaerolineae bacterium]